MNDTQKALTRFYNKVIPLVEEEKRNELARIWQVTQLGISAQFLKACEHGDITDARELSIEYSDSVDIKEGFLRACEHGQLELIKLLNQTSDIFKSLTLTAYKNGFRLACVNGHLTTAQYVFSFLPIVPREVDASLLFEEVCQEGHSDVANWLVDTLPSLYRNPPDILAKVCAKGHLEMAKTLNSTYDLDVKEILSAFRASCSNGKLEVAKWLLSVKTIAYPIDDRLFELIRDVCLNGHLETMDWLLKHFKVAPSQVWTIYKAEETFQAVCERGHLNVAKWLVIRFHTIHPDFANAHALANAIKNNHLEMAKWLLEYGVVNKTLWEVITATPPNETTTWIAQHIPMSRTPEIKLKITLLN